MNATPRDARPRADDTHDTHDTPDPDSDDARDREPRRARKWRLGAAQLAAPSTRRWRRAGRFDPTR